MAVKLFPVMPFAVNGFALGIAAKGPGAIGFGRNCKPLREMLETQGR